MQEINIKDLIQFLNDLDEKNYLTRDIKKSIWNIGITTKYGNDILVYLNDSNIDVNTFDDGSATKRVLDIIVKNDDAEEYLKYLKLDNSLYKLPRIGNFYQLIKGIKPKTLKQLMQVEGKESGRGVGKGEIFLASLFDDISMMKDGKGDLNWNGHYLEVKGSSARLGGRDRYYTDFENSSLGNLAIKYNTLQYDVVTMINEISNELDDKEVLTHAVNEFSRFSYPKMTDYRLDVNWCDDSSVRKYLTKTYFSNYINNEGVEYMIFINTKKDSPKAGGNYVLFNVNEMSQLVDNGIIGCNRIKLIDLDPCIQAPKIKC